MSYKFQARLSPVWTLETPDGNLFALGDILCLLSAIETHGNIAGACRECGMSYRHAWGLLRKAEQVFETDLLHTQRRMGTRLTAFARHLLWAHRRTEARLEPTLQSLSSELQEALESVYPQSGPRLRLHASHGFAVEGLVQQAAHHTTLPIELRYRTAVEALASLTRNECDLAGFQVPAGEFQAPVLAHYQPWLDPDRHRLIYLAQRDTGLFVQSGNPHAIQGIADLVKPGVRFVNRQVGSSTRLLVGLMLERLGIDPARVQGYDTSEFTHMAIAAHIASGMADAGIGVETAAWRFGLTFIPLAKERYYFAINHDGLSTPRMQELLALLNSASYRQFVAGLVGYEAHQMGQVMTLEEAFPDTLPPGGTR